MSEKRQASVTGQVVPRMSRDDEQKLIVRARRGNADAFRAIVEAYQDRLFAFVWRMLRNHHEAEDVCQSAFVKAYESLASYSKQYAFSTWLFTIAKRLYMNSVQKLGPSYDSQVADIRPARNPSPPRQTERIETLRNLRRHLDTALAGLAPQQREIILLFHQQNWAIAEIAQHLRMPQGTVKSHLHRGRKRMKRLILASRTMQRQVAEVWS